MKPHNTKAMLGPTTNMKRVVTIIDKRDHPCRNYIISIMFKES